MTDHALMAGDGRTPDADRRIATHEASHIAAGRWMGSPFGGATINADPELGYGGRVWGPDFESESRFSTSDERAAVVAKIDALMPAPGEDHRAAGDVYGHVFCRVIELAAGSVGERLFLDGDPWPASDDRRQERELAALIASSPEAVERFIAFAEAEAAAILKAQEHAVAALVEALLRHRSLDGRQIDEVINSAVTHRQLEIERERGAAWKRVLDSAASFKPIERWKDEGAVR